MAPILWFMWSLRLSKSLLEMTRGAWGLLGSMRGEGIRGRPRTRPTFWVYTRECGLQEPAENSRDRASTLGLHAGIPHDLNLEVVEFMRPSLHLSCGPGDQGSSFKRYADPAHGLR